MCGKRVMILYGSQKGCAQSIAEAIHQSAEGYGFTSVLHAANDFYKKLDEFSKEQLVVMVVSATGAGEHPDNCGRYAWLF